MRRIRQMFGVDDVFDERDLGQARVEFAQARAAADELGRDDGAVAPGAQQRYQQVQAARVVATHQNSDRRGVHAAACSRSASASSRS